MREEDTEHFHEWNSSDSEDSKASEDALSVPESAEGECDFPEFDEILQDVSNLFKEELRVTPTAMSVEMQRHRGGLERTAI